MKPDKRNNNNPNGGGNNNRRNAFGLVSIVLWALFLTLLFRGCMSSYEKAGTVTVPYTTFKEWLAEGKIYRANVESSQITFTLKEGVEVELPQDEGQKEESQTQQLMESLMPTRQQNAGEPTQYVTIRLASVADYELQSLLDEQLNGEEGSYAFTEPVDSSAYLLSLFMAYVFPVLIIVGLFWFLFRGVGGKGGIGGMGNLGKSNAKVYVEKKTGVTFLDVAGQDEAKESLQEIIDILHNPQKYTEIGAKLPKGALLVGPPGTGKTLLAKAVAGEAGVPFFSISGSDFVEMFVGMGAARVRDLFKEAAKMAPCIIFIDEIDTIGKSRDGGRFGGGNDEREQTLNQLLAELDGFDPGKGIIVLGATNRPEVLDKALLRPGRFDRRITVDRPNLAGRLATLQVHTRNIHLAEDVNLEKIAQATVGCVGADLANLVNEAALRAVRLGRSAVNQNDLLAAFETVIAGSEKKGTVITDEEKRIIAYHEVGHALVAAKQKNAQPVSKITIVPHTQGALGYTLHLPEEEKFLMSREDILAEIRTLLAGRSSEEVVCHTMTSGAANDIERATEMARNLVARFGMCEEFDMMALGSVQNQYLDGTYSMSCAQETYAAADRAVIAIIRQCHEDAKRMLEENRELLDKIAAYLLKKETITGQEMMAIIEGRDPETVDNYGATREEKQPLFRPSSPEVIEAPAKHIHIVSEPVPSPEEPQTPEEQTPEEAQPDRDPEENEHK